jgi:hypothetical protein
MEPRQPLGPLSGLVLLTFGGLLLLACLTAADGSGRRGQAWSAAGAAPQALNLHNLPPIPFGR